MKTTSLGFFILLSTMVAASTDPNPFLPAFPGAEGYGAVSIGGRGGRVLEVTSLADSGPGTLREALEAFGARTVVFRVGGVITLSTSIIVEHPFVTVAGQTAPQDGITLRFQPGGRGALIYVRTHDVILRYMKLRRGATGYHGDSLSILDPSENVVVDHCTITWATDENFEIYTVDASPLRNITIQRSLIAEALNEVTGTTAGHPLGGLISGVQETDLWTFVHNVDVHKSVFAHNIHRNPRVIAKGAKVVGNIMYNWDTRVGETAKSTYVDWIGNYFKHGPMSDPTLLFHESTDYTGTVVYDDPSIYIAHNIAPALPQFRSPAADNWHMIVDHYLVGRRYLPLRMRRTAPLSDAVFPISYALPSSTQFASVLEAVGANQRLRCAGGFVSSRDSVDTRIIRDAERGTGPTRSQLFATADAAGGYSTAVYSTPCADTDHDGMPDEWEISVGLDPHSPDDRNQDYDGDGYTNLEKYLNGTTVFNPGPYLLTTTLVKGRGAGGRLVSTPQGINCGSDCQEPYAEKSNIVLEAVPDDYSYLDSWSGGGCRGSLPRCTVYIDTNKTVQGSFKHGSYYLTATTEGTGSGAISSSPRGIICGAGQTDCLQWYETNTIVTLTGTAAAGSTFAGWTAGGCQYASTRMLPTCKVTLNRNILVKAAFTKN
jgi:List-Bact-rpt repeat protein